VIEVTGCNAPTWSALQPVEALAPGKLPSAGGVYPLAGMAFRLTQRHMPTYADK
jgi:hypothetical protein